MNLVDDFELVNRNSNGSNLALDGANDALANPPRCVGREFESAGVIELFDRLHQTHVALLNEVGQREAPV